MPGTAVSVPPGERLSAKLRLAGSPIAGRLSKFWDHPEFKRLYPELLRELFVVSRGGIPMMEAVRDQARRQGDPISLRVADYLDKHVVEERGHCEWVLDDLAALGFDRDEESGRPLSVHAASLLGCAYTWSFEVHPAAIMGFLAVFEGDPMTVPFLESVIERHGMPREAFGFYLDHARIDPQHSADIFSIINAIGEVAEVQRAISLCALHTLHLTGEILGSVFHRLGLEA